MGAMSTCRRVLIGVSCAVLVLFGAASALGQEQHQLLAIPVVAPSGAELFVLTTTFEGRLCVGLWDGSPSPLGFSLLVSNQMPSVGVDVVGSPAAYTYHSLEYNTTALDVFVVGTDAHLHRWRMYPFGGGGPAGWTDCTQSGAGGVMVAGSPTAAPSLSLIGSEGDVFVRAAGSGEMYRYSSGVWISLGSPTGTFVSSDPHAVAWMESIGGPFPFFFDYTRLFVIGGDGHLYMNDGSSNLWSDLQGPALAALRPTAVAYTPDGESRVGIDIFAVTKAGGVALLRSAGGGNQWFDQVPGSDCGWGVCSSPGAAVLNVTSDSPEGWGSVDDRLEFGFLWGCDGDSAQRRFDANEDRSPGTVSLSCAVPLAELQYGWLELAAPEAVVVNDSLGVLEAGVVALTLAPTVIYYNYWDGSVWKWGVVGNYLSDR